LQAVDLRDLEANYTGMGRAPYHPRTMLGLITYGTLKRKSTDGESVEACYGMVVPWLGGGETDV
jgi:transposase